MKANPKTSQIQKAMIKEKDFIDYIYFVFFVMLKNAIGDTETLVSIWKSSKSGIILHATLIIGRGGQHVTDFAQNLKNETSIAKT